MLLTTIIEGIGLGALLVLVCAVGIRKGAVGLLHLYEPDVQERCVSMGLTTKERIKHNQMLFKVVCLPIYIAYILVCVYVINGARGFAAGFWPMLVMLFVLNLIDRFFIDEYWVGHTKAWIIPGTEDMMPYISSRDKAFKWVGGIVCSPIAAAILAGIMTLFVF